MKKKGTLVFLLLFFICFYSFANSPRSVVSGIVTSADGKPVEFVVVSVEKSNLSTMTNEKGEYSLSLVSGRHKITFYCFNYVKSEQTLSLSGGEARKLNVVLKNDENFLSEVIIHGKSEKEIIETKGFAVNVIETQQASLLA